MTPLNMHHANNKAGIVTFVYKVMQQKGNNFAFFMGFILITLLVFSPNFAEANNPGKDFLITLNGSKLTGNIKDVSFADGMTQLHFENDFGNNYVVNPATIFGFVWSEGAETHLYESKHLDGKWQFLKVEQRGQALSMYVSTERQLQFTHSGGAPIVVKEKNPQIWFQFKGEQPFKVYRFAYKRTLRKKMEAYPDLSKNIGKRGFRYKDLSKIVELYNRLEDSSK